MFNTIANYLGFVDNTSNGTPPISEQDVKFCTKETVDQWTLVDIASENPGTGEVYDYPTPPPSPKLEQSWLVTPPPCFNADGKEPIAMLTSRENLLIEHPSMFVPSSDSVEPVTSITQQNETNDAVQRQDGTQTTLRRSQRKAARQAAVVISQQNRRNQQSKRTKNHLNQRNNRPYQRMRQVIQQPRKRC